MNDKNIILRILRLDKEIYNELLVQKGSFQKSIAIFVSTTILITMSGFRFISGLLDYLQENLILFQQEFSPEEFNMFKSLIEELQTFINSSSTISSLFSSSFSSFVSTVIGLVIIYLLLKFLFRKDPMLSLIHI